MNFKVPIWYPIASVLSALNLVAVGFAASSATPEPWHAATHAALGLGFGLWAQRVRQTSRGSERQASAEVLDVLEAIETEVSGLRKELSETQERLDFTERMLAQGSEARRMDPPR